VFRENSDSKAIPSQRALETVEKSKLDEGAQVEVKDLKSLYDGVKLTDDILMKTLNQFNITRLSPMGEKFDPKLHEAMFQLDSDKPKDEIVHLMQPGWKIKDRLLRAARVGTSRGPKTEEKKE
jgi:molecular chaperone GrpE